MSINLFRKGFFMAASALLLAACTEVVDEGNLQNTGSGVLMTKVINTPSASVEGTLLLCLTEDAAQLMASGDLSLRDQFSAEVGINVMEPIFTIAPGKEDVARRHNLHKWFKVEFDGMDNTAAAAKLAAFDAVVNVQYDKVVTPTSDLQFTPYYPSPVQMASDASLPFNDPLLVDQWHYINTGSSHVSNSSYEGGDLAVKDAWRLTGGDPSVVVAVFDCAVNSAHEDLTDALWVNEKELNGESGKDDDGNGIVDDIHGYDFVNKTGGMADFNGHGTHCAGIAAAVGNNGIGITGANPDALIMPITVMQSDGTGDVATIIKGIDYAAANGADVISMSLGGYNYSIAEEQALGKAYATAVIVAAAGNDHKSISDIIPCKDHDSGRMFPAAFQFVLGVESSDKQGNLASFSNYDPDGPVTSEFSDEARLYNYELRAPGVSIMSTFPKGQYRTMNGTSMACPLAAGAISRLLQCKEYPSKELLFGDLINTRTNGTGNMNILAAYNIKDSDRKPNLSLVTYQLNDSLGDNDGRPDAGDTIAFYPTLRNDWGNAKNIQVWLEVDEVEDASLIKFVAQKVRFGKNLSSYGKDKSTNPIRFIISKNCVDGRNINLVLKATCDNMKKTLEQKIQLKVENGVELGGLISSDLTLYPDVHYIVTSTLLIPTGVTLTILPGATIKFKDYTGFNCQGTLVANGTPGNMITFTKTDLGLGNITTFKINSNTLSYARFDNLIFNHGTSAKVGAKYLLTSLVNKKKK